MATTTVNANADGSAGSWTNNGGGAAYLDVEDIASTDDVTTYTQETSTETSRFLGIDDMPGTFSDANTVDIDIRLLRSTSKGDAKNLWVQIFESDESTAITDEVQPTIVAGWTTYNLTFSITGTNTKASWDGAVVRFRSSGTNGALNVTAMDVNLDYNTASATPKSATDTVGAADVLTKEDGDKGPITDTVGGADELLATVIVDSLTDVVAAADAISAIETAPYFLNVTFVELDTGVTAGYDQVLGDSVFVTDGDLHQGIEEAETIGAVDVLVVEAEVTLTDTVGAADDIWDSIGGLTLTETVTASDVLSADSSALPQDSVTANDAFTLVVRVTLTDTVAAADVVATSAGPVTTDTVTATEDLTVSFTAFESITSADLLIVGVSMTDTVSASDAATSANSGIDPLEDEVVAAIEGFYLEVEVTLTDGVQVDDIIGTEVDQELTDTVTVSTEEFSQGLHGLLSDFVTTADVISKDDVTIIIDCAVDLKNHDDYPTINNQRERGVLGPRTRVKLLRCD